MKRLILLRIALAAPLLLLAQSAAGDDPSLDQTFEWLRTHIAEHSRVTYRESYGSEVSIAHYSWGFSGNPTTCDVTLRANERYDGKDHRMTLSANLRTLAGNRMKIMNGYTGSGLIPDVTCNGTYAGVPGSTVRIETASEKKTVTLTKHDSGEGTTKINRLCVSLGTQESAERVMRAFVAACKACGCPQEPF